MQRSRSQTIQDEIQQRSRTDGHARREGTRHPETVWPLTSSAADGAPRFTGPPAQRNNRSCHPSVPHTLSSESRERDGVHGMVAEPLN